MTASVSPTSSYVAISRRTLDLEDYIDIARRHAGWIAGPLLAGIVTSIVVAFVQPNVYVSQAEIEITPATISDAIVKTTVNQRLTERILQMQNEVLSRTSLSGIIQDPHLDLYKTERASKPVEDVIEAMRGDVKFATNSVPGEGGRSTSAVTIKFFYQDRVKARDTVQALITKLNASNENTQRTQQAGTNSYVHDELTTAKATLERLTEELNKFRAENSGKLPEQSQLNIAQLTAAQQQSGIINDKLNRLAQERVETDARIQTLENQIALASMFDKEAPPSAPLARRQNDELLQLNRTIENSEANLAQLKEIYRSNYPDIRDAEKRLQVMKNQRDVLQKKQDEELAKQEEAAKEPQDPAKKSTNFQAAQAIGAVQGKIEENKALDKSNEMQRAALLKEQQINAKQIETLSAKLEATSGIAATYAQMMANQTAAAEKYQTVQRNEDLIEQNGELLQRKLTENLEVIDPPSLPMAPTKPNRWMIVGAGTAIAFIFGLALAGVQEAKDSSLKNLKDVRAYTNLPVLSSIPLLENTLLVRRKRRIAYLGWSAAVILGMLAVSASLYYHYTSAI
jgi:succinoglycan biosynthesis transport protein ExoP